MRMPFYTACRWLAIVEATEIVCLAVAAELLGAAVGCALYGVGLQELARPRGFGSGRFLEELIR